MKDYRITIEPISTEAKRRHVTGTQTFDCESAIVLASSTETKDDHGKLVALQATTLGPRQLVAYSIFAYLRDVSNRELYSDLSRLMLAEMLGSKPCVEVERHENRHGMPPSHGMTDELLAALFGDGRNPRH